MAFIEINGYIGYSGFILFLANLCWVFGYDTIYALVDKADDVKIGIKTSAISLDKFVVKAIFSVYLIFIFLMILIGIISNLNDLYWVSILIVWALLFFQIKVIADGVTDKYLNMFLLNNWIGAILFFGILLSLN